MTAAAAAAAAYIHTRLSSFVERRRPAAAAAAADSHPQVIHSSRLPACHSAQTHDVTPGTEINCFLKGEKVVCGLERLHYASLTKITHYCLQGLTSQTFDYLFSEHTRFLNLFLYMFLARDVIYTFPAYAMMMSVSVCLPVCL